MFAVLLVLVVIFCSLYPSFYRKTTQRLLSFVDHAHDVENNKLTWETSSPHA